MPKYKVGDQVLHLLGNRYTPIIIEQVFPPEKERGYHYGIRYLDGGASFAWDEEEFFTREEATARELMARRGDIRRG
jgi:hypothetical protein